MTVAKRNSSTAKNGTAYFSSSHLLSLFICRPNIQTQLISTNSPLFLDPLQHAFVYLDTVSRFESLKRGITFSRSFAFLHVQQSSPPRTAPSFVAHCSCIFGPGYPSRLSHRSECTLPRSLGPNKGQYLQPKKKNSISFIRQHWQVIEERRKG